MPKTKWNFPAEIPIDSAHTLQQNTGRLQSVADGLPELVKNSKDHYARLGVTEPEDRQIAVIVNSETQSLAVLDFAGMQKADFVSWTTWSDRKAGRQELAGDIEAGHGNGGKAFMVRGSVRESSLESSAGRRRTKMGFDNQDPAHRYKPAPAVEGDGDVIDVPVGDPRPHLDQVMALLGMKFEDLPGQCKRAYEKRSAYTIALVQGVKDWDRRRASTIARLVMKIPPGLATHAQAALSMETCQVWLVTDGTAAEAPIQIEYPEPFPGFEETREIPVPTSLPDPLTNEDVRVGQPDDEKVLRLHTSDKQLRISPKFRALNVIRVRNARNFVGIWSVARIASTAQSSFIYGDITVPSVGSEHLADASRVSFADVPLIRALEVWTASQIEALSEEIEQAQASDYTPQERERATEALDRMRDLMREFLARNLAGAEEGEGGTGGKIGFINPPPPPPARQYGSRIDEIVLESGNALMGLAVGTSVPLVFSCYELDDALQRKPIRDPHVTLESTPSGVTLTRFNQIRISSPGTYEVWLRDPHTERASNRILVEAVACAGVVLHGPGSELARGQKTKLTASFVTEDRGRVDLLMETSVDEQDLGRLSRAGLFSAGLTSGSVTCRVKYGPGPGDSEALVVEIGEDMIERRSGAAGADIPYIVMCGDQAPNAKDLPPGQQTHPAGDHHPTVIENPIWENVIWINTESRESRRARNRGPTGQMSVATKLYTQFFAIKCFDILKSLLVRQELGDTPVTALQFTNEMAVAEMDCADFIEASFDLADDLYSN